MNSKKNRNAMISKKILQEINDIRIFIKDMSEEDYSKDIKTQKAIIMTLLNIGELSKAYTDEFIEKYSTIPWKKIQAMRNVAAHKYEIIDMGIVWDTIQISIPELEDAIRNIA